PQRTSGSLAGGSSIAQELTPASLASAQDDGRDGPRSGAEVPRAGLVLCGPGRARTAALGAYRRFAAWPPDPKGVPRRERHRGRCTDACREPHIREAMSAAERDGAPTARHVASGAAV